MKFNQGRQEPIEKVVKQNNLINEREDSYAQSDSNMDFESHRD